MGKPIYCKCNVQKLVSQPAISAAAVHWREGTSRQSNYLQLQQRQNGETVNAAGTSAPPRTSRYNRDMKG